MARRTQERPLIPERALARVVAAVERYCEREGLSVRIDVAPYQDPGGEEDQLLITAAISEPVAVDRILDAYPRIALALRSDGYLSPDLPVVFVLSPDW